PGKSLMSRPAARCRSTASVFVARLDAMNAARTEAWEGRIVPPDRRPALLSLRVIGVAPKARSAACLTRLETPGPSLPRHLRAADPVAVKSLVVVQGHGHLDELSGEFERRRVVRDGRAAVAADVEAGPGDEIVKAERRADGADRLAVDQQGDLA